MRILFATRLAGAASSITCLLMAGIGPAAGCAASPGTLASPHEHQESRPKPTHGLDLLPCMQTLLGSDWQASQVSLELLKANWKPNFSTALVEFLRVSYHLRQPGFRSACFAVIDLLEEQNGVRYGANVGDWFRWIWSANYEPHPQSMALKALLYKGIDPRFEVYFDPARLTNVRLDEVRWGGVLQDGIPPLRAPRMIAASEALYLKDEHVVFGLEVNGDARAYPKRILAWHEMFTDKVGGLQVTGVY